MIFKLPNTSVCYILTLKKSDYELCYYFQLNQSVKAMKFYVLLITSAFLYLCYMYCIIFENQYVRFVPLDGTANRKVLFEIALLSDR